MLILVGGFTIFVAFFIFVVITAPNFDIEKLYTKEASIVVDSAGNEIARLGTENREKVSYDQLPEDFIDALIATEDSRFFQHNGLDMARFLKATLGQVLGNSGAGGASTLTMQVVKQRYTDTTATGIKGIIRKFTDIYMAVFKIEKNYTKEQIIEFYVNIPYLGGGSWGIEQASETYFGKPVGELTLSESALLAGLFQAPNAYDPFTNPDKAEARRNQVLNLMQRHGYITEKQCELAKKISVTSLLVTSSSSANVNQGFIDTVVEEVKERTKKNPYTTPMKIYSTMIQAKQDVINNLNNGSTMTWPDETIQTGIAVTDVKTGALVAVGAGRNRKGELSYNYATMINRHPGSTAKPIFDYGPAIEYLNYSTGTTIVDDQYTYSNGAYIRNWDNSYKGIMTVKTALAASRNIPALQTFQALSQDQVKKFVTGLGITPEYDSTGYINESHSIGGFNGVTPLEMSAAYGAFARGGVYIEPYSFTKIEFLDTDETYTVTPEKRTVMSEATAYMINMILKFAVSNGYVTAGSKSGTDVASKTGTSTVDSSVKKYYNINVNIIGDSWQMVYSPDYVCGVWVGYSKITSTQYLTDTKGGIVKRAIVKQLTNGILEPNSRWEQPSSVVSATVELETIPLTLASDYTPENLKSVELFKKGTVPGEVSTRFSQLENPTNVKATVGSDGVNLSWSAIATPDAISQTYLEKYFKDGYKTFADKYYKEDMNIIHHILVILVTKFI
jgi:penicillin-binding protein 1A